MAHTGTSRTPFSASPSPSVLSSSSPRDLVCERVLGTLPAPLTRALRAAGQHGCSLELPADGEVCVLAEMGEKETERLGARAGHASSDAASTRMHPSPSLPVDSRGGDPKTDLSDPLSFSVFVGTVESSRVSSVGTGFDGSTGQQQFRHFTQRDSVTGSENRDES